MDLQETIVLRIKREGRSHLATNYRPEGLQRTAHASSERHQWKWWTPLWWCLDWIWWFWILRRLEFIFVHSPRVSGILGYISSKEAVQGPPEVGTAHLGAPGAPPGASPAHWMSSGLKICTKSFAAFGLRLILITCDVKNMQKTATGSWHYVSRLVPKNDIKWL